MGSVQRALRARKQHRASGLVLLMIFSSLAAFSAPVQASIATDDLAISSVIQPQPEIHYDTDDLIDWTPSVLIENQYNFNAVARTIDLEICGGDHTGLATCPSEHIVKESSAQSPNLNRSGVDGDSAIVSFWSFLWFVDAGDISTYSGVFTIMFHFAIEDSNAANDHLRYTVTIEEDLVDLIANQLYGSIKRIDVVASAV